MNFKTQSEQFIKAIQTRKRNPVSEATIRKYEANLKYILPLLGNRDLSQVNNGEVKVLVQKLSDDGLSASTINGVVTVVKLVMASAIGPDGSELYPRSWNYEFIDVPVVVSSEQDAPTVAGNAVSRAAREAKGQWRGLYALLAGSGARIGEALALYVGPSVNFTDSTWDPETGVLNIQSTVVRGHIQPFPKTEAGIRQIDLALELNEFLKVTLVPVPGQLVFKSNTGNVVREMTAVEHLKKAQIPGFHSLRRFRVTQLRQSTVPEGLIKFWIGHQDANVTDRYDKTRTDVVVRRRYAQQAGLGFELPKTA